ncbi:hypothetical protein WMY93_012170 [Mugilogobius chulae]|uniref:C-type lectin domain-containing protein n=1 Tax=Mugilogobius chulae TaxID=88201 RepID=A0AAW0PF00_9GOBI
MYLQEELTSVNDKARIKNFDYQQLLEKYKAEKKMNKSNVSQGGRLPDARGLSHTVNAKVRDKSTQTDKGEQEEYKQMIASLQEQLNNAEAVIKAAEYERLMEMYTEDQLKAYRENQLLKSKLCNVRKTSTDEEEDKKPVVPSQELKKADEEVSHKSVSEHELRQKISNMEDSVSKLQQEQDGQSSVIWQNIEYHYYPSSWLDAQKYCREAQGRDLLTVLTQSEINNKDMKSYYAWIGLKRYPLGWYWYDNGNYKSADSQDFKDNTTPQNEQNCAVIDYNADRAVGDPCDRRHFFFCDYWQDGQRQFEFFHNSKSQYEAAKFCRTSNRYLACFKHWDNRPSVHERDFPVWTGLYHDGESWRWSDGDDSDFWKTSPGFESDSSPGSGLCGAVWSQSKNMSVHDCSEAFPFLCNSHNLVLVKENLTWEEALEECKVISSSQSHQLLSVELSDLYLANSKALDAQMDKVWLGLRFLGGTWFWSNGQTVSLPGLPSCPDSKLGCGALLLDKTYNVSMPQPL